MSKEIERQGKADDRGTLRRIRSCFRPYRRDLTLVSLGIVVTSLLGLANPLLIRAIFDDALAHQNIGHLCAYAFGMLVAPACAGVVTMAQTRLNSRVSQGIMRDLRQRMFDHMQRMTLKFYTSTPSGEIYSRISGDISGIQQFASGTVATSVANIATVLGSLLAMIWISLPLTLITLSLLPVYVLLNGRFSAARKAVGRERQSALGLLSIIIHENLSLKGTLLARVFGQRDYGRSRFTAQCSQLAEIETRQQLLAKRGGVLLNGIFAIAPALVYFVAGWYMIRGRPLLGASITAGTLVAFTALQARLFPPAAQLVNCHMDLQAAWGMFERIFGFLDLPVEIDDRGETLRLNPAEVKGGVAFERVSFSYTHPTTAGALNDFSFTARPGEVIAVTGPNGAGKTTLAYLLARLYEPDAGRILVDGRPLRQVALSCLPSIIGMVTQEPHFLHASVRENLLFARPDATDEDLINAAKAALIHDRIVRFERGYDSVVGEEGFCLSGGEKQRLAIARLFLRHPKIIILDEATSALDSQSEILMRQAIVSLVRGRTAFIIAHRAATVRAADKIIVLEKGKLVQQGAHAELIAKDGLYGELFSRMS